MQHLNTFSIETPKGIRRFHLHQDDICHSTDELVVVSSHAHPNKPLSGKVLEAVRARWDCDFATLQPLLLLRDCCGTFAVPRIASKPNVFLVRIPSPESIAGGGGHPIGVLSDALWTMFGSLAALELKGEGFRSISLPVLAGDRNYPIGDLLKLIFEHSLRWLRFSQTTEEISLFVLDENEFQKWSAEMDGMLGRRYFETANDSILEGLRQELLAILRQAQNGKTTAEESDCIGAIVKALSDRRIKFQDIANAGRKLTELLAAFFLGRFGVICNENLYEKIKKIRGTDKVAPWVISYLLTLKDLGNEPAHLQINRPYQPTKFYQDDLLVLLCSISRLVRVWLQWDSDEPAKS